MFDDSGSAFWIPVTAAFSFRCRPRIKRRPRFTKNDALSTTKKRPATCLFGLGRVAKTISNFPR